jgi:hypothetical protein
MSTEHKRILNVLEKVARQQSLSRREKKRLEEYTSRSQEHQVVVAQLSDPEWVKRQLQRMSTPSPREEMWENICKDVQFVVTPMKRKFPYF